MLYEDLLRTKVSKGIEEVWSGLEPVPAYELSTALLGLTLNQGEIDKLFNFLSSKSAEPINVAWETAFLELHEIFRRQFEAKLSQIKKQCEIVERSHVLDPARAKAVQVIYDETDPKQSESWSGQVMTMFSVMPKVETDLLEIMNQLMVGEDGIPPLIAQHLIERLQAPKGGHWVVYSHGYETLTGFLHNMKNKLATLRLFSYTLLKTPEKQSAVEQLRSTLDVMERVFQRALPEDIKEPETIRYLEVDTIAELILSQVSSYASEAVIKKQHLTFENRIPKAGNLEMRMPPESLWSIVHNFVTNAINYTQVGGSIVVSLNAAIRDDQNVVTVTVSDDGPGISEADRELVFKPYYRGEGAKVEGSGMGLHLCRKLAENLNGSVELLTASEEDGLGATGTTFMASFHAYPHDRKMILEKRWREKLQAAEKTDNFPPSGTEEVTNEMSPEEWDRLVKHLLEDENDTSEVSDSGKGR